MPTTTVGLLHPGAMGEALGRSLRVTGARVLCAVDGRSAATRARATSAGFDDVGTVAELRRSDLVVSICPPEFALDVARETAAVGFTGTYLDANAIAPSSAAAIEAVVRGAGATFVDGGVVGGPDAPRLFLSGATAGEVGRRFGEPVSVVVLDGPEYAASALKMVYAGWTKGTTALLFALAATADALGVADALDAEWARSQPALGARLDRSGGAAAKAWRWSGEMREIAATLDHAGLPSQFHDGAAEVYERLSALRDEPGVTIDDVIRLLRRP
jgi:3-hydroxyisobutyrate dehydrogenase-like beta-hydroxyacid dehydrogenase